MPENNSSVGIALSIDIKKNRIRVYKTTLHRLGTPPYIQLLVNPVAMQVAIRSIDFPLSKDALHKVTQHALQPDNSYEIYSYSFIRKLEELVPQMKANKTYRIQGKILPEERAAIFSLRTLCEVGDEAGYEQNEEKITD